MKKISLLCAFLLGAHTSYASYGYGSGYNSSSSSSRSNNPGGYGQQNNNPASPQKGPQVDADGFDLPEGLGKSEPSQPSGVGPAASMYNNPYAPSQQQQGNKQTQGYGQQTSGYNSGYSRY